MPRSHEETLAAEEKSLRIEDGVDLFYRHWKSDGREGAVVVVHGGGEHSGRYEEFARRLTASGFDVYAADLRGHGRSSGKRGHANSLRDFVSDLRALVDLVAQNHGPPFLMAHSMGGLIGTYYAIEHGHTIRGLALSSPMWGLSVPVPALRGFLGRLLGIFVPRLVVERPAFGLNPLSHDLRVVAAYVRDPLVHSKVSLGLYRSLHHYLRRLQGDLPRLQVPSLVMQAGNDMICSALATSRLFPSMGAAKKRLIVYDGFYHEILNETGKDRVFHDLLAWLAEFKERPRRPQRAEGSAKGKRRHGVRETPWTRRSRTQR